MTTPNTPHDESLSDEVLVDEQPTPELPSSEAPAAPSAPQRSETAAPTATVATVQAAPNAAPAAATATEPTYLRGPAPFAIVLGLLGLVVAGVTLVAELTDLTIPWDDLGPWTVVAAGLVVLLVGAIGLRASRTQD